MVVKHVIWSYGRRRGRLALAWAEGDEFRRWPIRVKRIHGCYPDALDLYTILEATLPEGWHAIRPPAPWRVEQRIGRSGCCDFKVRVLEDADLMSAPIAAQIHVSMRGLLNEGIEAPIWAVNAIVRAYPRWFKSQNELDRLEVVAPKWGYDDFELYLPLFPEEEEERQRNIGGLLELLDEATA